MRQLSALIILAIAPALSQAAPNPFLGRWDLTVTAQNLTYPGWLEVVAKSGAVEARMQPRGGSVRPIAQVRMEGERMVLVPSAPQANRPEVKWELSVEGGKLTGAQKRGDTVLARFTGVLAPALKRKAPKKWTAPESLFNGRDLTGWEPTSSSAANHWVARDGSLLNESKGANLRSVRKFDDFKVHVEFNCPEGGNSGWYLRGRYEIQIEYEPAGSEDKFHSMCSIYGYLAPSVDMPRKPGEWESFDATFVGRTLTLIRNGVKIMDNLEIPGITGGALDSDEGQPGPFYIQGDHTGGMKFRNMTVSVPR